MKKGEVLEGTVERVDFPNKGMVSCEGGWCVVKNALPGQKISYRVSKVRKGKAEGRLLEVLEKSPWEVESPCPHFGICAYLDKAVVLIFPCLTGSSWISRTSR